MVNEILRWNPAVPLGLRTLHRVVLKTGPRNEISTGLAHRLTSNDTYRGYTLPKGLVVWVNIWSVRPLAGSAEQDP